jgi:hypothetical protein
MNTTTKTADFSHAMQKLRDRFNTARIVNHCATERVEAACEALDAAEAEWVAATDDDKARAYAALQRARKAYKTAGDDQDDAIKVYTDLNQRLYKLRAITSGERWVTESAQELLGL